MDTIFKNNIARIQLRLIKAIKSHKAYFEKLQNGENSDDVSKQIEEIRQQILGCFEEQKILLKQLIISDGPAYKFDFYKIPPNALPKKNRRRKDLIQPVKEKKIGREIVLKRSPSPVSSSSHDSVSSSEESEQEEEEVLSQTSWPLPVPRPSLLRKNPSISRHDIRYPKLRRSRLLKLQDEEGVKELPMYNDPPPSPEPIDEHQVKLKFIAALDLIPKENLPELLSRKTERKRRSTANNQYLYNNDWEVPATKRKQYLAPIKCKPVVQIQNNLDKDQPSEEDSQGRSAEDKDHGATCKVCNVRDTLVMCADCNEVFHPKCAAIPDLEQSFLLCRRCNRAKNPTKPEEPLGSLNESSDSVTEEQSENNIFEERCKVRSQMLKILRCRMIEKAQMERKVLQLSESSALQDRVKMNLLQDSQEIGAKIDFIRNSVTRYIIQGGSARMASKKTESESENSSKAP